MIIVLTGRVRSTIPGREPLMLEPGTVTLFPQDHRHTSEYLTDTHLMSIHIESTSPLFDAAAQFTTSGMSDFGRQCLTKLTDAASGAHIGHFAAASCVCGLLSEFAERVRAAAPSSGNSPRSAPSPTTRGMQP